MRIILFMIIFIGICISCKKDTKHNPSLPESNKNLIMEAKIFDGNWELIKVNDTSFSIEEVYSVNYGGQPSITIDTEKKSIGGYTGCNAWGTSLNIQNKKFVFNDPIEKHEQGCGGNWEAEYLNFLRNNKSFTINEDNLMLISKNSGTMTFRRVNQNDEN